MDEPPSLGEEGRAAALRPRGSLISRKRLKAGNAGAGGEYGHEKTGESTYASHHIFLNTASGIFAFSFTSPNAITVRDFSLS